MADESSTPEAPESGASEQQPEAKPADNVPPEIKAALRKANKEAETLRLKLKEFEDSKLTETERLAERAKQAEAERDALRVEALRARVAHAKALPADLLEFLTGTTEEELSAQADRLLSHMQAATPARPMSDVGQGARTAPTALNDDKIVRDLEAALGGFNNRL